jgi:hypothetical protein
LMDSKQFIRYGFIQQFDTFFIHRVLLYLVFAMVCNKFIIPWIERKGTAWFYLLLASV